MNEEQAARLDVETPRYVNPQEEPSKEQREQRKRIEILKLWEIKVQPLDRGCVVYVGCKNFAFESLDAAMETVKQYVDNPVAVIKHYGFENYI